MTAPTYRIIDEPVRSRWDNIAVRPYWPLLALMMGGGWLSFPWSAINGFALGAPTRKRDAFLVVGGFAGSFVFVLAIDFAMRLGIVTQAMLPWALLVLTLWKLFLAYFLFEQQSRAAGLREYFGGKLRNGAGLALVAGYFGRAYFLDALATRDLTLLYLVLS